MNKISTNTKLIKKSLIYQLVDGSDDDDDGNNNSVNWYTSGADCL